MNPNSEIYRAYVQTLKEELIPAMGCTEPIAIAYAAAKAREVLGCVPDMVKIGVSNNIIKNVKSVIVPNTGGMKGIEAAAVAGIVAGQADKALEVISQVSAEQKQAMRAFLNTVPIAVEAIDNGIVFDLIVALYCGTQSARVRITHYHTNIVSIKKNGEVILERTEEKGGACGGENPAETGLTDRSLLNVADIYDFANTCDLADIRPVLDTQIRYNTAISEEGLRGDYGANVGSTMLKFYGSEVRNRAIAKAAAGSDARMSGCELPVVINSGSVSQSPSPSSSMPGSWGLPRKCSAGRWRWRTSLPSTKRPASGGCPPTAERSAQAARRAAASPTCRALTARPFPILWSTPWPLFPALSVTVPSPAARRRSRPACRQAFWDTICT